MDLMAIIDGLYPPGSKTHGILVQHGRCVADKALAAADRVAHLNPDRDFVYEAAMLHDIGILLTRTAELGCHGVHPYVCHGVLGRGLLEEKGLPVHGLVCERHVGVGLTAGDIDRQGLPLPSRDMRPVSIEEQIVCYADKFFSKTGKNAGKEKPVGEIFRSLEKYGPDPTARFRSWNEMFG